MSRLPMGYELYFIESVSVSADCIEPEIMGCDHLCLSFVQATCVRVLAKIYI